MATVASVRVIKSMPFKGGTRFWSNRYHFNGGTPADGAHWDTLFDNVTTAEKAVHPSYVTIIQAVGYAAGSEVPVRTKNYSLAGTHTMTSGASPPGECCALVRWSTAARSTKNHPIYLFSYFHGVPQQSSTNGLGDLVLASARTSYATYATSWITGFSDGTITAVRASPQGQAATGSICEEYITHRDFPYSTSL